MFDMSGGIVCKEKFLYVITLDRNFGHGVSISFVFNKKKIFNPLFKLKKTK